MGDEADRLGPSGTCGRCMARHAMRIRCIVMKNERRRLSALRKPGQDQGHRRRALDRVEKAQADRVAVWKEGGRVIRGWKGGRAEEGVKFAPAGPLGVR